VGRVISIFLVIAALIISVFLCFPGFEDRCAAWLDKYKANPWWFSIISFCILSSDILLPVPSSIIMFGNGAVLGITAGTALSMASVIAGHMAGFGAARLSRNFAPRFLTSPRKQEADRIFEHYGPLSIIITRGIPVLSEAITLLGGMRQMQPLRFLKLNILGYLPVCLLYSIFGHYATGKQAFLWAFAGSILIAGIYWLAGRLILKK
jgi:uncharacterized membrane protein YdjX (TVP38/TMEM64 family)